MESDENKVEVTGTVTGIEEKYTAKGVLTAKLSLRVHEVWATGSADVSLTADFYGKPAEFLQKKMADGQVVNGTVVRCEGKLGSYTTKAGYANMVFKCLKVFVVSNSGIRAQAHGSDEEVPY